MSDFWGAVGVALIVFAFTAPLALCTAQQGREPTQNDHILACIQGKGEWRKEGWGPYTCHWPKAEVAK